MHRSRSSSASEASRLMLGLVLCAFLLRLTGLGHNSLWYDEILEARIAVSSLADILGQLLQHAAMPLDYVLSHALQLSGRGEFWLRFPAAAFSTLAVAVLYRLGRALFTIRIALISALLLAVSSPSVFYAQEARPYSLLLLLLLVSFLFFYRALSGRRWQDWAGYAICAVCAALAHYFSLFVIGAQLLFLLTGLSVRAIAPSRAWLFLRLTRGALLGAATAGALVVLALSLTPYWEALVSTARLFVEFLFAPSLIAPDTFVGAARGDNAPEFTLAYLNLHIVENFSGGGPLANTLFLSLGAAGTLSQARRSPWQVLLLLIWALLPALLVLLFLIHRGTFFAARYILFALPPWLLLSACGVQALAPLPARVLNLRARGSWVSRAALALVLLGVLLTGLGRTAVTLATPKEDWRAAGEFLEQNSAPGDVVIAPGGAFVVFYYSPRTAPTFSGADTPTLIDEAIAKAARAWVVLSPYVFDPGDEIRTHLSSEGAVEFRVDNSISIFYVRPTPDAGELLAEAQTMTPPNSALALGTLAEQFAYAGNLQVAAQDIERGMALAELPRVQASLQAELGDIYRRAEQVEPARAAYSRALALDARNVSANVGLARLALADNRLPEAYTFLQHALASDPNSYGALLFLGEYYARAGQPDAARQALAQAGRIVPELSQPP